MLVKYTALLALVAAVQAIRITQPTDKTKWNGGETTTITWDSVSTDEDTFNLAIKDKNNDVKIIAENVDTSSHSYSYTPASDMDGEFNVQILSAKKNQGNAILAESGFFEIQAGSNANAQTGSASAAASNTRSDDAKPTPSSSGVPQRLTSPSAAISSGTAGQTLSMTAGENQPSAAATNGNTAAAPSAPAASPKPASGAGAIVPSLALVGGAVLAALF